MSFLEDTRWLESFIWDKECKEKRRTVDVFSEYYSHEWQCGETLEKRTERAAYTQQPLGRSSGPKYRKGVFGKGA